MFKTITLLKRRPGLSMAEFIEDYETRHRLIGEKYLRGHATRYVRRFLHSLPGAEGAPEPEHDVVMEIWFADRAAFERAMADLSTPEAQAEIVADEERLFDRTKNRFCIVEEHESNMG